MACEWYDTKKNSIFSLFPSLAYGDWPLLKKKNKNRSKNLRYLCYI